MKIKAKITSAGFLLFFIPILLVKINQVLRLNIPIIPEPITNWLQLAGVSLIVIGTILYFTK